jgi:ATP-dependent DNA helicase DinG
MPESLDNPLLEQCLTNIAQNLPNFKSRPTQRQMMQAVWSTLSRVQNPPPEAQEQTVPRLGETILIVEGPTGTGKSLGYLLPAILAAKQCGKHLLISSATVMLQEQLANKDIPFLAQHAGLQITYAIAKGRGRYACPQKLYQEVLQNSQGDLVGHDENLAAWEKEPSNSDLEHLKQLSHQLAAESWDGDRDTLQQAVPDSAWSRITNDRHGCLKRECAHFKTCPFYNARAKIEAADVVVVNHDLLLADLAMGGGIILPEPDATFYVIDEAHHLGDKAIQQFAASHTIHGTLNWLEKLNGTIGKAEALLKEFGVTRRSQNFIEAIQDNLNSLVPALSGLFTGNAESTTYRCPDGQLPTGFATFCQQMIPATRALLQTLSNLLEALKRQKAKPEAKNREKLFDRLGVDLGFFVGRVENLYAVWTLFNSDPHPEEPPIAKWIDAELYAGQVEYTLSASPVRASQLLAERLWCKAGGAVLTSATLRCLGAFDKLISELGLSYYPQTTCIALPSPFDLPQQGQLHIPAMRSDPKDPEAHTREIIELMPTLIAPTVREGTLVLFSSKKQMLDVAAAMPADIRDLLLIQGTQPRDVLLREHFERVAKQQASVLFGLASFAEGLDLPGKACSHLIIAKIPFSMPDDPVSQTLAEWITHRGGNAFFEMTLPEASIRLIQAVGRLIRSETDKGTVTILDNRLLTKPYGRQLKQALPAFRQVTKQEKWQRHPIRSAAIGSN